MPRQPATFGRLLRDRRVAAKLSQADLAERVGVSRQYVYRLEAGEHSPTLDVAARVAGALGCKVDDLIPR